MHHVQRDVEIFVRGKEGFLEALTVGFSFLMENRVGFQLTYKVIFTYLGCFQVSIFKSLRISVVHPESWIPLSDFQSYFCHSLR